MSSSKVVVGVDDIPTTAPWMIPYFQGGIEEARQYKKGSHKRFYPICPYCGKVKEKSIKIVMLYNEHSIGCLCNDKISQPNKIIYAVIRQLKELDLIEEFQREYVIDKTCFKYDMYFVKNNKKYLVEMDSEIHPYIREKHNLANTYREAKNDDKKDELAKQSGYKLIRIDCYRSDFKIIKNGILESELSKIINLDVLNWEKIFSFACNNFIKEVCDFKNKNPNLTTTNISKKFGISVDTVMGYLKKGNEIGWCHYEAKEAWYQAHKNLMRANRDIFTMVTDDQNREYYFRHLNELERNSKEQLGVYLNRKKVSKELKKNNDVWQYKHLIITRISKEEYLNGIRKSS